MFKLAFIIGIYSYLIFLLGIFKLLNTTYIIVATLVYFAAIGLYLLTIKKLKISLKIKFGKISILILSLIIVQGLVNLIGVFGPEISFDSLWYHLTLPKLYLINHSIFHIPGGLLYYSDMPKLTEMYYVATLAFGNETLAKLIHFSFGIFVLAAIYKISRKSISQKYSLIAALIFYSNLVVGWESITAYIDLSRTFFEVMTLWAFLNWIEKNNNKWLVISGTMLGFAISTKLVAVGTTLIFFPLLVYIAYLNKEKIMVAAKRFLIFVFFSILIPLPWFIFSFLNTGSPFYPYFSNISVDSGAILALPHLGSLFNDIYALFLNLSDPISPIYLILLPIMIVTFKNFNNKTRIMALYTFLAIILWYLTQQVRGGRFILPYLPAFSILVAYVIYRLRNRRLKRFLFIVVIIISLSSISYRAIANSKYVPVILGTETKSQFLIKNLNFAFGDFYDTDGYFKDHIKSTDKVLLYGSHNLYYVDFPFIDSSWVKNGDKFNYVAIQNSVVPPRFSDWKEIYYNKTTRVGLYMKESKQWVY